MLDASRAVDLPDHAILTGLDPPGIGVCARRVPARNPVALVRTQRWQRRQAGLADHGSSLAEVWPRLVPTRQCRRSFRSRMPRHESSITRRTSARPDAADASSTGNRTGAAPPRLGQVVVGRARVVVAQLVRVPVLDGDVEALPKPDRILDMVTVDRVLALPPPLVVAAVQDDAVIRRVVLVGRAVGAMVPVLGTGPVERRRPGLAVDEHHVVAFAVPVVRVPLEAVDVQVGAAVDAVRPRRRR